MRKMVIYGLSHPYCQFYNTCHKTSVGLYARFLSQKHTSRSLAGYQDGKFLPNKMQCRNSVGPFCVRLSLHNLRLLQLGTLNRTESNWSHGAGSVIGLQTSSSHLPGLSNKETRVCLSSTSLHLQLTKGKNKVGVKLSGVTYQVSTP